MSPRPPSLAETGGNGTRNRRKLHSLWITRGFAPAPRLMRPVESLGTARPGAGGEGYVGAHDRHEAPDDERRPPVAGPEPVPGLVAGHGRQQADDDDLPQRRAEHAGFQTMPARLNCLRVRARPHQQPAADAITAPRHSPAMVAGLSILVPARATSRAALPAYWSR